MELHQLGELLAGAFGLNAEVFLRISTLSQGLPLALLIVLVAGLSLGIGQSIILFINRVQPIRFIFSLGINAVLYTFGYLFLVLSTWLICQVSGSVDVPLGTLFRVLGLGYAPLLFSFLGALPYVGVPILNLLSVWHLLAMDVGFGAVAQVRLGVAFTYVVLGWFVKQLLGSTVGQPIARFGKTLADRVAGVELVRRRSEMRSLIATGAPAATPIITPTAQPAQPEVRHLFQAAGRSSPAASHAAVQTVAAPSTTATALQITETTNPADPLVQLQRRLGGIPQLVKLVLSLLGMGVLFVAIALLLRPIRNTVFSWYLTLPGPLQLVFDLVWIGVIAIVFAGLLAPLETLGWWAGWYDDEVEIPPASTAPPEAIAGGDRQDQEVSRYVIYLDGIGQSGEAYTPDVEDFLTALEPALPQDMVLIRGLMMYSVLNKPLDQDRPLALIWRLADKMRWQNPAALLGLMLNLRNVFIVAVSADQRYGPIYNQGIAQVLTRGLIAHGYQPGSGVPITLIGYSGGGQMSVAAAPYLHRATGAPIEAISLGGVMSANNNFLKLEHLYHYVGEKDGVERVGPIMFPGRWKILPLSYWNRAKRRGRITLISAGPVGHQVPGGYMDPQATLPNGQTHLQQTVGTIQQILQGAILAATQVRARKPSNYQLYKQAPFNDPSYYPLEQTVDLTWYRPIAPWIGRLILPQPEQRQQVRGALFEVHHAAAEFEHLVGQVVPLRWVDDPVVQNLVRAVTHDVYFSADADFTSEYGGLIHPERVNHWRQVGPLESLAGSHPTDDLVVKLEGEVVVEPSATGPYSTRLRIRNQPVEITGRYYALVRFIAPIPGTDQFRVVHFNPASRDFDGPEVQVRLPEVVTAEAYGSSPSTTHDLERSPLNESGWYIYGAKDAAGRFVVQSLAPRSLLRLQPERVIFGSKPGYHYIRRQAWADIKAQKGKISSVLLSPKLEDEPERVTAAIHDWQEGDRALVIHTYGGIGGNKREPAAATPIFFGHFAYGMAEVVWEPLAAELRFEIQYYQVYTHNTDGLTAGTLHWSRYLGDRQWGWAGTRPTCDLLIKHPAFTSGFGLDGVRRSALDLMLRYLQVMTARYRIGDGTGGTYVGPANNCSQDSNQALFASLRSLRQGLQHDLTVLPMWATAHPEQGRRLQQLVQLERALSRKLQPLGSPRSDWEQNEFNLGTTLEDAPLRNLRTGLGSWRTLLPRLASDTIVRTFLQQQATVWVLRTNQIGGSDPEIEPIAPMTL